MADERVPQHPEADLLAAFAESSLTQQERESVLIHLAACERCRLLVFLAQQAEPEPVPQPSTLKVRPFWRRKWFPIMASVSAVLALVLITFSWYGQVQSPTSRGSEVAQKQPPSVQPAQEAASGDAAVASQPATTEARHEKKLSVLRPPQHNHEPQSLSLAAPAAAVDSVTASSEELHARIREAEKLAARRREVESLLDSTQKAQPAGLMQSASGSKAALADKAAYSARAVQSAESSRLGSASLDAPASRAAAPSAAAYGGQWSASVESSQALPQPVEIRGEGCVEQGVEAGCLMVKDRRSGTLFHVMIKGLRPQPGDGIEFVGVLHDGPTTCMQGTPVHVINWVSKDGLKCSPPAASPK